jgi:hypothetical protein
MIKDAATLPDPVISLHGATRGYSTVVGERVAVRVTVMFVCDRFTPMYGQDKSIKWS